MAVAVEEHGREIVGYRERQVDLLHIYSRQPEPLFDFDLPLELVDVVAGFGIDVVGVATEIAVEAEFLDKPADAFERRLLRGGVQACSLVSERFA
jgi:hypothetical protein